MKTIDYYYNVGDTVQIKESFGSTASCDLKKLASQVVTITERRDYNGPCYKFEGTGSWFQERESNSRISNKSIGGYINGYKRND